MPSRSVSLYAFSDEELLAIIDDRADEDGYVTSRDIADVMGYQPEDSIGGVSVRLAWMVRYGVVERDQEAKPGAMRWRLTSRGRMIMEAKFSNAALKAFEGLNDDQLWRVAGVLSEKYVGTDEVSANLVRRQFIRGNYRRRGR